MHIGIGCFHDDMLCSIIEREGQSGHCDIQDIDEAYVYDTERAGQADLQADLSQIIGLYATQEELQSLYPRKNFDMSELAPIEQQIWAEWHIFAVGPDAIRRILLAVCAGEYDESSPVFSQPVALRAWHDDRMRQQWCLTYNGQWADFTQSIKHENRFHQNVDINSTNHLRPRINLRVLKDLLDSESLSVSCYKQQALFRARIADGEKNFPKQEMGAPPLEAARAGRLNPEGISYLYLADSVATALSEVRARAHDDVCIGSFVPRYELALVDFSRIGEISPFADTSFDLDWFAVNMKILNHIAQDVEKPMRRQDSLLEYLPSQFIAEFIKYLGFAGIRFRSTLHEGGVNYVIFSEADMQCLEVERYHVDELRYCFRGGQ